MEHLFIAKTDDTPEIDFNPVTKEMKLTGRSLPEDIHTGGDTTIEITWNYDERDTDMEEAAEEYSELVEVPFKIVGI
jgi:hypothetical protein